MSHKSGLPAVLVLALACLPSAARASNPDVCRPVRQHTIFLPHVAKGAIMPKGDLQRGIDELSNSTWQFYEGSTFDAALTKVPDVPSGITVTAVVDGVLITVDYKTDKSHESVANFEGFIVYARTAGDTTDTTGEEVGRIPKGMTTWTWQPKEWGSYTGIDIALTAVTNTGYESAKTDWQRCTYSTFHDDFSDYGGSTVSPLEHLYWLKVASFDSDEAWFQANGTMSTVTTGHKEGTGARKVIVDGGYDAVITLTLDETLDLSAEQRFGTDDYFCGYAYFSHEPVDAYAGVIDGSNRYGYAYLPFVAGANYFKVKRSDFVLDDGFDWSDIRTIEAGYSSDSVAGAYAIWDDWRIVKASAADPDTFDDTGGVWSFPAGGTWHIYTDAGGITTLGQIETTADGWKFAYVQNVNVPNGRRSIGLELRKGGCHVPDAH